MMKKNVEKNIFKYCQNCGKRIGMSGMNWVHTGTGLMYCYWDEFGTAEMANPIAEGVAMPIKERGGKEA